MHHVNFLISSYCAATKAKQLLTRFKVIKFGRYHTYMNHELFLVLGKNFKKSIVLTVTKLWELAN